MGGGSSYELDGIQLHPLDQPVVSINPRFAHDELLTLQRKSSPLGSTISFRNIHTNAVRFTVNQTVLSSRLTLFDCGNVAAANCRSKTFDAKPLYYVRLGGEHDCDPVFAIHVHYRSGLKTEVLAKFTDRVTHDEYELGFEGHWRKRTAYFWLARRSDGGVRKPVAKVFCPVGVSRSRYHVAVAPHMDAGLIALVCGILEEQQDLDDVAEEIFDD